MANSKRMRSRAEKIEKQMEKIKQIHWPTVTEDELWSRKTRDGFSTIPRGLPLIMKVMDDLSSGQPVSMTYFALWCRVYDHSVVTIQSNEELAYESGFSGQRAESTWAARMKQLERLGFIKIAGSGINKFHYILILNPYRVAMKLYGQDKVEKSLYLKLQLRADNVGADDMEIAIDAGKVATASEHSVAVTAKK